MLTLSLSAFFVFAYVQAVTDGKHQAVTPSSSPAAASATTENVSTPADPKERMELGRKVNGLLGLDAAPWHLKASYEVFETDGKSKDKGTFEEWRVDVKQYKLTFHSPQLSLEEYGTLRGVFRTGERDWPGRPVGMIPQILIRPFPLETDPEKRKLKNYERNLGTLKLECRAYVDNNLGNLAQNSDSYCFAPTNAILLYATSPQHAFQTLFEHVSFVQGHYVGRDIEVFLLGRRWLSIHLEALDALGPSALPDLSVPANAIPVSRRLDGPGAVSGGSNIRMAFAEYPPLAKTRRVEGMVILGATVGVDGHIKNIELLAGAPLLQKPAIDAVQQWVYQPLLIDAEPVEFDIELQIEFHLTGS
jgi:TonB family protein